MIRIKPYKHKLAIYFTPTEAKIFDSYIVQTALNKNYVANRAIEEFIDNKIPIVKSDARHLDYEGEKKTKLQNIWLSNIVQIQLDITAKENCISRSSLAAQAIMSYIEHN